MMKRIRFARSRSHAPARWPQSTWLVHLLYRLRPWRHAVPLEIPARARRVRDAAGCAPLPPATVSRPWDLRRHDCFSAARFIPLFAACVGLALVSAARADHWPQLRGPLGTGTTEGRNLPVEFGPEQNVRWKLPLGGHSAATPAVWGEHIFLLSPDGQDRGDVYLLALDLEGRERWRRKLCGGNRPLGFNGKNNLASPSPVTDGEHVWQLVGTGDLYCFDFDGRQVWHVSLFDEYERYQTLFGIGFSPLLFQGALYIPYLHQGDSFVLAIDAATGQEKWKTARRTTAQDESKDSYSSPCVFDYGDRAEIVICGADLANAYDSATGREVWRHGDINPTANRTLRIIVSPVSDGERIYVASAKRGPIHAIRPGGQGDVTSSHRLWTATRDTPDVPTPAVAEGLFYMLRENGVLTVLDAASGQEYYQARIAEQSGAFSPSPVVADGKVYMANESGLVVVVAAGREFQKLAENRLGELIMATPVVVDDRLYVRTEGHLYCFSPAE